jgi:circadian clock protein KaiC
MVQSARADGLISTGVAGLDEILGGGFPPNRLYLIQGNPGAGKTTLALQFLLEGLRHGERGLYVTLSESDEEVTDVARAHGWSLEGLERITLDTIDGMIRGEARTTVFHPSEMELEAVSGLVSEIARRCRPARVVFDSLSEFRLLAESALRYRHQLLELKRLFSGLGSTVLLLDDMNLSASAVDPHVLSLAHGVVNLSQLEPEYGAPRRRLQASKMRASRVHEGYHDFTIRTGGLEVYPRLRTSEVAGDFHAESIPSGNARLDALLGGGVDRGTTTLIMGPAGTGKSSLALLYAARTAAAGEQVMLYTFDETLSIALARARALGVDLAPYLEGGLFHARQVDPADLSPGEFAHRVREGVENGVKLVILDSLNGYLNAMPGESYLIHHLHELSTYLNQKGVATLLILTMHGILHESATALELTYLADMAVSLRFFEANGEVRKAIAVIKKRSGAHESTIRELRLVSGVGIEVGPALSDFSGVLSGIPEFHGKASDMLGT